MKKQFISIYNSESDAVFRYCFLRTSSRELSFDLSQESFMRLWDSMISGKKIENHRAFLYTVARNLIIDWYRKKKTISLESLDQDYDEVSDKSVADKLVLEDSSKEKLEMEAEGRYLIEKINELDDIYQQPVFMRYVLDLKPQEIAEILNESVNVISVRISRGMDKLKKKYE